MNLQSLLSSSTFLLGMCILIAGCLYAYQILFKRRLKQVLCSNPAMTLLTVQGVVWVALSYGAAMGTWFPLRNAVAVDSHFIVRQAFYLALLMAVEAATFCDVSRMAACLQEHNVLIAILLFLLLTFTRKTVEFSVQDVFLFCALSLMAPLPPVEAKISTFWQMLKKDYPQWVLMLAILILTSSSNGTSTILLLKLLYLGLFIFRQRKWVMQLASLALPVILVVSFLLPMIPNLSDHISDANTRWRMDFWQDEVSTLIDTYGVGIGYGTAYPSEAMIEKYKPVLTEYPCPVCGATIRGYASVTFVGNGQYSDYERPFVTASHNSFVSLGYRLGVVGLLLFCAALWKIWKRIYQSSLEGEKPALAFLFCGTLAMIALNVGLESPHYLIAFLLAMSWINARCGKKTRETPVEKAS